MPNTVHRLPVSQPRFGRPDAAAERDRVPLTTHSVFLTLNDTFRVNLIGRGYPSPNTQFRWCTGRLKIYPVSDFIKSVVNRSAAVVVVLGARKSESDTRAQTMNASAIPGQRFRPHADLPKDWVHTPQQDSTANEIRTYLLRAPSPWDGDNRGLVGLYKNAAGGGEWSSRLCYSDLFGYGNRLQRTTIRVASRWVRVLFVDVRGWVAQVISSWSLDSISLPTASSRLTLRVPRAACCPCWPATRHWRPSHQWHPTRKIRREPALAGPRLRHLARGDRSPRFGESRPPDRSPFQAERSHATPPGVTQEHEEG